MMGTLEMTASSGSSSSESSKSASISAAVLLRPVDDREGARGIGRLWTCSSRGLADKGARCVGLAVEGRRFLIGCGQRLVDKAGGAIELEPDEALLCHAPRGEYCSLTLRTWLLRVTEVLKP